MIRTASLTFLATLTVLSPLVPAASAAGQNGGDDPWSPPDLVDAIASFGAIAHDGALYVYGGHVGRTHAHSRANISPGFRRLRIDSGETWEELARGPLLQGGTLASDGAWIYRAGGMTAMNATADEPAETWSSRSAARYSVAEDRWEPLPDLPAGRSSHDLVVTGGVLYVVGGWEMRGPGKDSLWSDSLLALDLANPREWRVIPAPFQRRAIAAGTAGGRIYALGGLTPGAGPVLRVDVFDTETGTWSAGPDLPPAGELQGFGAAAASFRDTVLVCQADGKVYHLAPDGGSWTPAAELGTSRFMHRILPFGDRIFGVGGATREGHLATVEIAPLAVPLDSAPKDPADPARSATRWTGFRGGKDVNVSRAGRLPLTWDDESVTWRVTTPGFGQSSPVIWDGTVFLTSVEGAMKEMIFVSAIGLADGVERWRRTFEAAEKFEWNDYVAKGAPTPAVDAERLYAFFDSGDFMALTHDGETVWHRMLGAEYGTVGGNHGVGNSVLLTGRAVVVMLARKTYSYLLAVDPATGETLWKTDREPGVSWTTPVLTPPGDEIVVSASGEVEGYDARTGERLWIFEDLEGNNVASPTVTEDLVIVGGLAVEANLAIRRGGTGALGPSSLAWKAGSASNFGSPFLYRDCVYWVNPAGAARCLAPDSGVVRWTHRLPASTWATPLGHRDTVYFFTQEGVTQVLSASAEAPEVIATNHLSVDAPVTGFAVVDDAIVIRAGTEVIRVGQPVE